LKVRIEDTIKKDNAWMENDMKFMKEQYKHLMGLLQSTKEKYSDLF